MCIKGGEFMDASSIATNNVAQVYATQKILTATDKQNTQAASQVAEPANRGLPIQ